MSRYYDSVHLASDQKDLLISQLKAEIFEIQQRDKDYLALRDQLYAIQTKYRHLQDEKLLQENEFKTRQDSNCITLHGLKKECDDARHHLNDKSQANNAMQAEIAALREQISRREAEIFGYQRDCQSKGDHSFALRKDIDAVNFELQKQKEERCRDQGEIDRLRDVCALKERENAETDARIRGAEHDLHKLQERVAELTKISEHKDYDLKKTSEAYDMTHLDLCKARDEAARLADEQANQRRLLDMKNIEKAELVKRLECERARNAQLTAQLYDLEGRCRNTEAQLAAAKTEQNDLRFSNQSLQQ
jgi:chromosome segregation ATPase